MRPFSQLPFDSKFAAYALAGAAMALSAPTAAQATVIYTAYPSFGDRSLKAWSDYPTLQLDLNGDSIFDLKFVAYEELGSGHDHVTGLGGAMVAAVLTPDPYSPYYTASALAEGSPINSTVAMTSAQSLLSSWTKTETVGQWDSQGTPAYLGLAFQISGQTHYGWVKLGTKTYQGTADDRGLYLYSYAYNDAAGVGLTAGQTTDPVVPPPTATPEPSTLALTILGAAGVMAARRRRAAAR